MIIGALTDWVTNDLMNTSSFNATQSLDSAATNAVNLGIQNIRYAPLLYTTATGQPRRSDAECQPAQLLLGQRTVAVRRDRESRSPVQHERLLQHGLESDQFCDTRQVTVSACRIPPADQPHTPAYTNSWAAMQSSCAAQPLLQAIVTFDDYPPSGVSGPSQVQCVTYCGSTLTINSWNWTPTVPTVASVTGLQGSIDGGQPMTITGTGFTNGTTVNFVNSNPLAQVNSVTTQQIVPAANVSVTVATQTITAQSPSVTTLANYYVTVTTPGHQTSAVMVNASCTPPALVDCFQYSTTAPFVKNGGVSPITGYTTHSTAITITGSGFINGATVTMVQDSGGTPNAANEQQATAVQVVSNTEITALTYPFTTVGQVVLRDGDHAVGGYEPDTNRRRLHVHPGTTVKPEGER